MTIYLIPIKTALLLFPILALIITIPFIIKQYRSYGSILVLRAIIIYSFVFYLLCAYFLTMLPLPPIDEVASLNTPTMQLVPFASLQDFLSTTTFQIQYPSTYLSTLSDPNFYQIAFNFLLLVPLGIYLRYYFQYNWKRILLISFCVSLSFELIQLSGLFGIYPRPYRLFDVDDLIINTLSGGFGYFITPIFAHFLPKRTQLDFIAYSRGTQVSTMRRIFAFVSDLIFFSILWIVLCLISNGFIRHYGSSYIWVIYYITIVFYFVCIPCYSKGKTLGKMIVKIKLIQKNEKAPFVFQLIVRYGILYGIVITLPYHIISLVLFIFSNDITTTLVYIIFAIALATAFLIFTIQFFLSVSEDEHMAWYERISRLHNISTVTIPATAENVVEEDEEPFPQETCDSNKTK